MFVLGCLVLVPGFLQAEDCPTVLPRPNAVPQDLELADESLDCTPVGWGPPIPDRRCYTSKPDPEDTSTWSCWCRWDPSPAHWCKPTNNGCFDDRPGAYCRYGYKGTCR